MSAEIIFDLPWAEYTQGGFLGSSAFADWKRIGFAAWSREHLEEAYTDGGGSKWTAAGSAIDRAITGDPHGAPIIVKPEDVDYRTKAGKEWRDRHADCEIIDAKQEREIESAKPMVRQAIEVMRRVIGGEVRYQVTLRGEVSGLKVQTRPDIMIGDKQFPDLKYINPNDFGAFDRKFVDSRYLFQAGLLFGLGEEIGIDPAVSFLLAESCTELPRVEVVKVPRHYLVGAWDHTRRIADEIAAMRDSDSGFTDRVVFREMELSTYNISKIGVSL